MKNDIRPLSRYFVSTFIFSWLIWSPVVLACFNIITISQSLYKDLALPLMCLGAFGPLFGALFSLRKENGKGALVSYLKSFADLRIGWSAFIIPVLIIGMTNFAAWYFPKLLGHQPIAMMLPSFWWFLPYLILMILFGGGQEEFGWRGYALPRLEEQFGLWTANTLLGVLWATWHIPLWFIQGSSQSFMNFGSFMLFTVGLSYLFSWFRKLSGNKPFACIYAHGLANAFVPFFPTLVLQKDTSQPGFWVLSLVLLLIGVIIMIIRTTKTKTIPAAERAGIR